MRRYSLVVMATLVAGAGLFSVDAVGVPRDPVVAPASRPVPAGAVMQADKRLREHIEGFRAENISLRDVLKHMEGRTGVPFEIEWDALAAVGVRPQSPVTVRVDGAIRASKLITCVLFSACAEAKDLPAIELLESGELLVTTNSALRKRAFVKEYDVAAIAAGRESVLATFLKQTLARDWVEAQFSVEVVGGKVRFTGIASEHRTVACLLAQLEGERSKGTLDSVLR